ncbi:hypothetical protein BP5796_05065 [Coleophoma crateriformis]|uniref:ARCA protein n=1 Tax=Coleophoma crateriformis TaxID=565419 RepID=A0A3D8S247_9HELO|nr:hypothetical protein BP5796_05065 [Coleophoma crateriformis]
MHEPKAVAECSCVQAGRDEAKPAASSSSSLTGKSIRFRHGSSARYDQDFPPGQQWVKISGKLRSEFVDETLDLNEYYGQAITPVERDSTLRSLCLPLPAILCEHNHLEREVPAAEVASTTSWVSVRHEEIESEHVAPGTLHDETSTVLPSFNDQFRDVLTSSSTRTSTSPNQNLALPSPITPHSHVVTSPSVLSQSTNTPRTQRSDPISVIGPKLDEQEACLLRYFIENLARWFDLCDPDNHFATVVPQRAISCPPLLYAIFTASARHLCRLPQHKVNGEVVYLGRRLPHLHKETAIEYHNKCIEHLVSLSSNADAVFDQNLLAASVILRFYEEVDAPFNGGDFETGLRGTQVFIDAQVDVSDTSVHDTGLRRAAIRVAYRQEIVMAFTTQRSFRFPTKWSEDYRSLIPADDYTWAHRAVVHCADVLKYCFGEHRVINEDYDELLQYHRAWSQLRPQGFNPIFESELGTSGRDGYPEIWLFSDCHVIGIQHHDLAKILLTVYDPRLPRLGPSQRRAARKIEAELKSIVRRVCGIALSNRSTLPAMNTACMAIALCGDQFSDPHDQQVLLDILHHTDYDNAWPTGEIQEKLKESWGWNNVND